MPTLRNYKIDPCHPPCHERHGAIWSCFMWALTRSGQAPIAIRLLVVGTFNIAFFGGCASTNAQTAAAFAWGDNAYGDLGDGTNTSRYAPVAVSGLPTGATTVVAGTFHSLAVVDGATYSWGDNNHGQLGSGTSAMSYTPIAVSGLSSGVTDISAGALHSLAIRNGAIYGWGRNISGELGHGAGADSYAPVAVTGMTSGVTAIAAGSYYSLAIRNGAAYTWGYNNVGQLGDGTTTTRNTPVPISSLASGVSAIAAGDTHSLAIKNGGAYAWGRNLSGELGDGTFTNHSAPTPIASLSSGVTSVAAGEYFSLAVRDGGVYAWGYNGFGQLGDGSKTNRSTPIHVAPTTLTNIVSVAANDESSYALSADGSLWVWGGNPYGDLGIGGTSTNPVLTPQHLLPPTGASFTSIDADATGFHAVATLALLPQPTLYFTGGQSTGLNAAANYSTNLAGTVASLVLPDGNTDVYFTAANAATTRLGTLLASNLTVNSITFGTGTGSRNATSISGSGMLTIAASSVGYPTGTGIVKLSGSAAVTINVPVAISGSQTWTNNSTTGLTVVGTVALGANSLTLDGIGAQTLSGSVSGDSGSVNDSATGVITISGNNTYSGPTIVNNSRAVLKVGPAAQSPLLSGGGGTDIQNGAVVFNYGGTSIANMIRTLLQNSYANGFATGQLRSSSATERRGLGYVDDGSGNVTVKATLYGDIDLDGGVSINDFNILAANFGQSGKVWSDGDFDFDGGVSINDFNLLAGGFGLSASASAGGWVDLLAFAAAQNDLPTFELSTGIPEPTAMCFFIVSLVIAKRRAMVTVLKSALI